MLRTASQNRLPVTKGQHDLAKLTRKSKRQFLKDCAAIVFTESL